MSSEIIIRQADREESLFASAKLRAYAFMKTPPASNLDEEYREMSDYLRNVTDVVVYEDAEPLVIVGSQPMTQNIRGKVVQMAGILGVASHPLARRRGFVRQALQMLHSIEREKGKPVAGLYPFRESFYHRIGYVQFPRQWEYVIPAQDMLPALKTRPEGEVELHNIKDIFPTFLEYMRQIQGEIHGMSLFDDHRTARLEKDEAAWVLIAKYQGEIIGMMLYRNDGYWKRTTITHFFYHDPRGRYLMLDFLGHHADQASEFYLNVPTSYCPEQWITDIRMKAERPFTIPMGRVLDIETLSGIDCGDGAFSVTVIDEHCPWNSGHWRFEGKNRELRVSKADSGEAELTIQAISALIYGTHDSGEYTYHGWGTPTGAMVNHMRNMFPLALPFMHEHY